MVQISSSTVMLTVARSMEKRRRAFPYITSQSRFSSSRNLPESTDCSKSKGRLVARGENASTGHSLAFLQVCTHCLAILKGLIWLVPRTSSKRKSCSLLSLCLQEQFATSGRSECRRGG